MHPRPRTRRCKNSIQTFNGSKATSRATRTYCVYLAKDEATIRKHGKISGIPVTKITEIHRVIDPLTAHRAAR